MYVMVVNSCGFSSSDWGTPRSSNTAGDNSSDDSSSEADYKPKKNNR